MRSLPTSSIIEIVIPQTDNHRVLPALSAGVNSRWLRTCFDCCDEVVDPSVCFKVVDFISTVVFNQIVEDRGTRNPFEIDQLIEMGFEVEWDIKIDQCVCFHWDPYLTVWRGNDVSSRY